MENHRGNIAGPINPAVKSAAIEIRKGRTSGRLGRAEFSVRFRATFIDPAFRSEDESIARLEEVAWQAYTDGCKTPFTQKAGPGYADPDYELSVEWMSTKQRIEEAQRLWNEPSTPVTGIADLRLGTQRWNLSRRDVQILQAVEDCSRNARAG